MDKIEVERTVAHILSYLIEPMEMNHEYSFMKKGDILPVYLMNELPTIGHKDFDDARKYLEDKKLCTIVTKQDDDIKMEPTLYGCKQYYTLLKPKYFPIKCLGCGFWVSDMVDTCPRCRRPVQKSTSDETEKSKTFNNKM